MAVVGASPARVVEFVDLLRHTFADAGRALEVFQRRRPYLSRRAEMQHECAFAGRAGPGARNSDPPIPGVTQFGHSEDLRHLHVCLGKSREGGLAFGSPRFGAWSPPMRIEILSDVRIEQCHWELPDPAHQNE